MHGTDDLELGLIFGITLGCRVESHLRMQFLVDDLPRRGLGSLLDESFGPQANFNLVKRVSLLKHITT